MKNSNNLLEYCKQNKFSIKIYGITTIVSFLIAFITFSILPKSESEPKHSQLDTIYIDRNKTDSLLKDVLIEVHEINEKLKPKKVYIKTKPKNDTIRIDANVKIQQ